MTENPRFGGSIPSLATISIKSMLYTVAEPSEITPTLGRKVRMSRSRSRSSVSAQLLALLVVWKNCGKVQQQSFNHTLLVHDDSPLRHRSGQAIVPRCHDSTAAPHSDSLVRCC